MQKAWLLPRPVFCLLCTSTNQCACVRVPQVIEGLPSALRREVVCHIVRPQLQCVHILDRADPELLLLLAGLFRPLDVPQGGQGRGAGVVQGVGAVGHNAEGYQGAGCNLWGKERSYAMCSRLEGCFNWRLSC